MKRFIFFCLALIMPVVSAFSQSRNVSGTVLSAEDGAPIIGALVAVTGSESYHAVTDLDGKFRITAVPDKATTVTVSILGFKTQAAQISQNMVINLQTDSQLLEETIVVAYGTAKKSSYSGSASMVKSSQSMVLSTPN